jgi:energy-coupling factor transport system ATP-binding protein
MRDVEMTYPTRDTPALRVASIDIEAGSHVVVIGMSGSGKSTLLDVITGVAPSVTGGHCRGVVRVGVEEVQQLQHAHPIAAVFQEPEAQIFVGMVAEEIAFGLRQAQLPAMVIAQRVRTVLAELGISHLARRDCATLSGGELQRVLLAAALALQPSVLVLDEPTSQIDAASERRFWDAVAAARQARSLTIVTVEHRLSRVLHDADKVIVCVNGVASDAGPPHEIANGRLACLQAPYEQLAPAGVWTRATPRLQVRARRVVAAASSDHVVMRDMDFALMPGSIVTLEGSNGSGKSTLLRAIRGLGASDMDVFVDGHPRGDLRSSVGSVALLSQEAGMLVAGRSVRDAASLTAVQFDIDLRLIDEALTSGGLGWARNMDPASLSVGERQRLAIISATAHRPLVWLLDEPTRGMDVRSRRWVAMLLLAHAAAGGVVLVATHDSALAAAIATHRLRLDTQTGPSLMSVRRDDAGRPMEVVKSSEIAVVTT